MSPFLLIAGIGQYLSEGRVGFMLIMGICGCLGILGLGIFPQRSR